MEPVPLSYAVESIVVQECGRTFMGGIAAKNFQAPSWISSEFTGLRGFRAGPVNEWRGVLFLRLVPTWCPHFGPFFELTT